MNCKVRFAPSPTGHMHIGNARIAVINYLFSRKNKGHFLFRIDDTDAERSEKKYEESIRNDLEWLGISYDSSLRQSERTHRYEEIKNQLIEKELLYKCYESQEELEYKRKLAIGKGKMPIYDRASLKLSKSEQDNLENSGILPYWRFKLPDDMTISWNDIVMGNISYNLRNVSDPVIVKTDGTYLYTFTSIIDDLDYEITHIIRGQDHVTNTSVQMAIFNAISGSACNINFAHLSLLVNRDGSQFSKRLGSLNLGNLREEGVDSMSISSLLATLGSSQDTLPFTSLDDLIEYFDITKFSSNSPKFDIDELFKLNKKIIHKYSYEEIINKIGEEQCPSESVFDLVHENVEKMGDFQMWKYIFSDNFECKHRFSDDDKKILLTAYNMLEEHNIDSWIQKVKEVACVDGKNLYMPLRIALTGLQHGPNLTDIVKKLGVLETKRRTHKCSSY
ncbi:MAG: glutamate--tRNA ligase [Holosporales bacterium]|jgi:glutamyl-tRNA synthetase|nr:glutamate--tRNA ligase [Holosporales bacterium]